MTQVAQRIETLFVIGLGLIGGSVARMAKASGFAGRVLGFDENLTVLAQAQELGVIDSGVVSLREGLKEADLTVIAVPTLAVPPVFEVMNHCWVNGVVTDVASVKGSIRQAALESFGHVPEWLVLGHPIAGSERSGVTAANQNLFANYRVILTPDTNNSAAAIELVSALWRAADADVLMMSCEKHDEILAATSHLPHLLAYSLVDTLVSLENTQDEDVFRFAAGGFRDFSRIAGSNPQMWHDIVLANHSALLSVLDEFESHLAQLRQALEAKDSQHILDIFARAQKARNDFAHLVPVKSAGEADHESDRSE